MFSNSRILVSLLIIICLSVVPGHVFAAWNDTTLTQEMVDVLNIILQLLSWLWMPFASIAGALMSNTMVYGEFLNLGKVLRLLWGISLTFANFVGAAGFLYYIINSSIKKDINLKSVAQMILKLGGGMILANASFFLIGAVVDISTVLTVWLSSFPSTYISNSPQLIETITENIKKNGLNKTTLHLDQTRDSGKMVESTPGKANTMSDNEILDIIMPRENSISWPLIYIGGYVLKATTIGDISPQTKVADILLILLTRVGLILVFTGALIMLIVLNLYRIVTLRFTICLAPLLIVMKSIDRWDKWEEMAAGILGKFSISNVIKLIFAPAVSTALIGILLILVVTMDDVLQSNGNRLTVNETVSIQKESNGASTIAGMNMFSTTIEGDLFGNGSIIDSTKNIFSDLLMFLFTGGLLRWMVWGITKYNEWGIGGETMEKMQDLSKSLLGAIPIIPLGGGRRVGVSSALKRKNDKIKETKDNIKFKTDNTEWLEAFTNSLRETIGLEATMGKSERQYFYDFVSKAKNNRFVHDSKWLQTYRKKVAWTTKYYQQVPDASLSSMGDVSNSIERYLRAAASNREYQNNFGVSGIQLSPWEQEDTMAKYIERNYKSNSKWNKEFFLSLYDELWGNSKNLKELHEAEIGEYFWNKKFKRKKAPPTTTDQEDQQDNQE